MKTITDLYPDFAVTERPDVPVCVDGNPSQEETWALLALARHVDAKTALDLGTYNGATAYMLASVVEHVMTIETGYWPVPSETLPLPENVSKVPTDSDEPLGSADFVLVMVNEKLMPEALHAAGDHVVVWHAGTAERLAAGLDGRELYAMGDRMAVVRASTQTKGE